MFMEFLWRSQIFALIMYFAIKKHRREEKSDLCRASTISRGCEAFKASCLRRTLRRRPHTSIGIVICLSPDVKGWGRSVNLRAIEPKILGKITKKDSTPIASNKRRLVRRSIFGLLLFSDLRKLMSFSFENPVKSVVTRDKYNIIRGEAFSGGYTKY